MIGNFDTNRPDLNVPSMMNVFSDYSKITDVFLSLRSFRLANAVDMINDESWLNGIKTGQIFPLHDGKKIDDSSESAEYTKSIQDFKYSTYDGKIIFDIYFSWDIEFHKKVEFYSGQLLNVFFFDINQNVYGWLNGSLIDGFQTDVINLEKITFGATKEALSKLHIELSDYNEVLKGVIKKVDFDPSDLFHCKVSIADQTNISINSIQFTIVDDIYGCLIRGLEQTDMTFLDVINGELTITSLQNMRDGSYVVVTEEQIIKGDTIIDNLRYSGISEYQNRIQIVFESVTKDGSNITSFVLRELDTGSFVNGLTDANFIIEDNINGLLTISNVINSGLGSYSVTTIQEVNSGNIKAVTNDYYGITDYVFSTYVNILDITQDKDYIISFDIQEALTSNPVNGILISELELNDVNNGILTIINLDNPGNGHYILTTETNITIGELKVLSIIYYGVNPYVFTYEKFEIQDVAGEFYTNKLTVPNGGTETVFLASNYNLWEVQLAYTQLQRTMSGPITDVFMFDPTQGYMTTKLYNTVYYFYNSGNDLIIRTTPNVGLLRRIHAHTNSIVNIVGDEGTSIVSTDGGATWDVLATGTIQNINDIRIYGQNQDIKIAVGYGGIVLLDIQTGSWSISYTGQSNAYHCCDILSNAPVFDDYLMYVGGAYRIIKSTNQGVTWIDVTPNIEVTYNGIRIIDVNTVYVIGNKGPLGVIYKTDNGGDSWYKIGENESERYLTDIDVLTTTTSGGVTINNDVIKIANIDGVVFKKTIF